MRRTIQEVHSHLVRENPLLYGASVLAMVGAGVLWLCGHERWALAVFIVAGLVALPLVRYKGPPA